MDLSGIYIGTTRMHDGTEERSYGPVCDLDWKPGMSVDYISVDGTEFPTDGSRLTCFGLEVWMGLDRRYRMLCRVCPEHELLADRLKAFMTEANTTCITAENVSYVLRIMLKKQKTKKRPKATGSIILETEGEFALTAPEQLEWKEDMSLSHVTIDGREFPLRKEKVTKHLLSEWKKLSQRYRDYSEEKGALPLSSIVNVYMQCQYTEYTGLIMIDMALEQLEHGEWVGAESLAHVFRVDVKYRTCFVYRDGENSYWVRFLL